MRKFSCTHCGHRLAVPPKHLGRLVTCPECGRETHPLAEQILSLGGAGGAGGAAAASAGAPATSSASRSTAGAPAAPAAAEPSAPAAPATCANCGQTIGRLQKRNLWDGSTVCTACYQTLSAEKAAPAVAPAKAKKAGRWGRAAVPTAPAEDRALAVPEDPPARALRPQPATTRAVARPVLQTGDLGQRLVSLHALQLRQRLLVVLAAVCVGGAAVYGALSLLRDLTGLLTTAAIVLFIAVVAYLLMCATFVAGKRIIRGKWAGGATAAAATVEGKDGKAEVDAVVVRRGSSASSQPGEPGEPRG